MLDGPKLTTIVGNLLVIESDGYFALGQGDVSRTREQ
jgi:hypothetical protein